MTFTLGTLFAASRRVKFLQPAWHANASAVLDSLFNVSVNYLRGQFVLPQRFLHGLGQHHRAVLPARAAERNCQVALALSNVMRDQVGQQAFDAPQKFSRLGKRPDITAHLWVFSGESAQPRHEGWLRQKSDVENQIAVRRD